MASQQPENTAVVSSLAGKNGGWKPGCRETTSRQGKAAYSMHEGPTAPCMPPAAPSQHMTAACMWTVPPHHTHPHPPNYSTWTNSTLGLGSIHTAARIYGSYTNKMHTPHSNRPLYTQKPKSLLPPDACTTVLHGTKVLLYTTHKCRPRPKSPAPPSSPKTLSTCTPNPENPVRPGACSLPQKRLRDLPACAAVAKAHTQHTGAGAVA